MRHTPSPTHRALAAAGIALGVLLTGCASVYRVDSQVQSFARWPQAGTPTVPVAPQRYRFERLPSQLEGSAASTQDTLEALTRSALGRVGWTVAATGEATPWTVQVSAGTLQLPRAPWDEPRAGLRPSIGLFGGNGYWGTSLSMRLDMPYYERQLTLVIRHGATGQAVYETSARHDGRWASSPELWGAMLDAALRDFPQPPSGPRQINIDLPR